MTENELNKKEKAIILLSGGLDSLLTLAIAINNGLIPHTLHINYGQATQAKELKAFNKINKFYGIDNEQTLIVDVNYLKQIGGSNLTNSNFNAKVTDDIPNSYVPFRNANILAIATAWAEVIEANHIFIGASEVDFSGYPDCRRKFFDAFEAMIDCGTRPSTNIKITTPLMKMTKTDIVKKGNELNIPFELSWSCYYANDAACGVCDSCKLRLRGFANAGIEDPIKYK